METGTQACSNVISASRVTSVRRTTYAVVQRTFAFSTTSGSVADGTQPCANVTRDEQRLGVESRAA